MLDKAERYGLSVSGGGSDYHGTNKRIPMGMLNSFGLEVRRKQLTVLNLLDCICNLGATLKRVKSDSKERIFFLQQTQGKTS